MSWICCPTGPAEIFGSEELVSLIFVSPPILIDSFDIRGTEIKVPDMIAIPLKLSSSLAKKQHLRSTPYTNLAALRGYRRQAGTARGSN